MSKIIKYSKPSTPLLDIKQDFFENNVKFLEDVLKVNNVYSNQERRTCCKNCGELIGDFDFISFGIPYSECKRCEHLNGYFEDSDEFVNYLYADNGGENYKSNYLKNYDKRVENIYLPKVDFLSEVINHNYDLTDIGCGGGHFVKACELRNINARGVDPNETLVELGSQKIIKNKLNVCKVDEFETIIENSDSRVTSMIGVLEHLKHPQRAIKAFKNSNSEFLYISVPLVSFSVFIEHTFTDVFPRHLSGGHTHLYSKNSINYLANKFGLEIMGEWWFGSDIMDLYRSILMKFSNSPQKSKFNGLLNKYFGTYIDKLQNILDKEQICSEVHVVFRKK